MIPQTLRLPRRDRPLSVSSFVPLRLAPSAPLSRYLSPPLLPASVRGFPPPHHSARSLFLPRRSSARRGCFNLSFPRFNGLFFHLCPWLGFFLSLAHPPPRAAARSTVPPPPSRSLHLRVIPRSPCTCVRSKGFAVPLRRASRASLPPFAGRSVSARIALSSRFSVPVPRSSRTRSDPLLSPSLAAPRRAAPERYPCRGSIEADALSSNHAESAGSDELSRIPRALFDPTRIPRNRDQSRARLGMERKRAGDGRARGLEPAGAARSLRVSRYPRSVL